MSKKQKRRVKQFYFNWSGMVMTGTQKEKAMAYFLGGYTLLGDEMLNYLCDKLLTEDEAKLILTTYPIFA